MRSLATSWTHGGKLKRLAIVCCTNRDSHILQILSLVPKPRVDHSFAVLLFKFQTLFVDNLSDHIWSDVLQSIVNFVTPLCLVAEVSLLPHL